MTDTPDRPADPAALALPSDGPHLDAHGFDPAAYDWIPVRRVPRHDGWSAEKQRLFVGTLADTGSVTCAAREVGMSAKSAYALRRAPDGAGFARAWDAAIRRAMDRLIDVCLDRALEGTEEPIFNREGRMIGHRVRHHDRMAMFLLRAHRPDLFRDARREAPPPPSMAEAVKAIDPVAPVEPAALMAPDDLAAAIQVADIMDGELPRWHRDPDLVVAEREAARAAANIEPESLGPDFEAALEAAKNGTWQPPRQQRSRRDKRA